MKFFALFGDTGFFVVFFNWFVWSDKIYAVGLDLYQNLLKLLHKFNKFIPVHIK